MNQFRVTIGMALVGLAVTAAMIGAASAEEGTEEAWEGYSFHVTPGECQGHVVGTDGALKSVNLQDTGTGVEGDQTWTGKYQDLKFTVDLLASGSMGATIRDLAKGISASGHSTPHVGFQEIGAKLESRGRPRAWIHCQVEVN
ncbi:MAG: hypothetical protein IT285_04485 [Bdellovibrionales bacterium]|nr:hypothetical protein [Bdellovibrionales bacterium]